MRILTIVKRVPDSKAPINPLADGRGIDATGLRYVCDPFDEFGVEQAVRLRESGTDVSEIVAIGVGPQETEEVLRTALAMGADRAVRIPAEPLVLLDELAIAGLIAEGLRAQPEPFDLILCGKQSIDNDAGELGPALAELLDLPHVGAVTKLEPAADGRSLTANRRIEGAEEVMTTPLPALVTCEKGLVEPRHPALPKLMKAKKQPVETIEASSQIHGGHALQRLTPPPPRPPCRFIEGTPQEMARELVRCLRDEAKVV